MSFPIALQLYSIRDYVEKDFRGALKEVKNMGYEGVEFAGLYNYSIEEIKEMLNEIGLKALSAHIPMDELLNNTIETIGKYKALGCDYIAIPWMEKAKIPGGNQYEETVKHLEMIGKEAQKQGLVLLYHNHDFEFVLVDNKYALDVMYDMLPSDWFQSEIDTCWVNVAGENPSEYIKKYRGRAPVVHLKDFVAPQKKIENMYGLIGETEKKETSEEKFEFRPVGYGVQKFEEILDAAHIAETKWVVVEQDSPSMGKTSMECAKMSIEHLKMINS